MTAPIKDFADIKNLFQEKRNNNQHMDLVGEVKKLLSSKGVSAECIAIFETHPLIVRVIDSVPEIQRHNLNLFWTMQLMSMKDSSIEARYGLLPNGSPEDWIEYFNGTVMPYILENNLPKVL